MEEDAISAAAPAGELRVRLGKLMRRLCEKVHPGDLTWSQVSVPGRLEQIAIRRERLIA